MELFKVGSPPKEGIPTLAISTPHPGARRSVLKLFDPLSVNSPETRDNAIIKTDTTPEKFHLQTKVELVDHSTVQHSFEEQVNQVKGVHDIKEHLHGTYAVGEIDPVEEVGQIGKYCPVEAPHVEEKLEEVRNPPIQSVKVKEFHEVLENSIKEIPSFFEYQVKQEVVKNEQIEDTLEKQSITVVEPIKPKTETFTSSQSPEKFHLQTKVELVDHSTVQHSFEEQVNQVKGVHDIKEHLHGTYAVGEIDPVEEVGQIGKYCPVEAPHVEEKLEEVQNPPIQSVKVKEFHEVLENSIKEIPSFFEYQVKQEVVKNEQIEDTLEKQSITVVEPIKPKTETFTSSQSPEKFHLQTKVELVDHSTVQHLVEEQVNQVKGVHHIKEHLHGTYAVGEIDPVEEVGQIGKYCPVEAPHVEEKLEEVQNTPIQSVKVKEFHEVLENSIKDIPSFFEYQVKQEAVKNEQIEKKIEDTLEKQSITVVGPIKPKTETFTSSQSKMGDLNDTLNALQQEISDLKLKLNASQQEKASLELEIRQKEEVIIKSQAEALKSEQLFKQELKQLKEQLKENTKHIENDVTKELQEQLQEAKSREAKLLDDLAEKKNVDKVAEKLQSVLKARLNENVKLKEDLDSAKTHLANLELAFSDLHLKYEKTKESLEGYKKHTAELLINLDVSNQNSKQQEERYESLKTYAKNQIERANRENAAEREKFANDNAKLQAIIKRLEIKCGSLEVNLSQKTEECHALAALCDEVTGKKV